MAVDQARRVAVVRGWGGSPVKEKQGIRRVLCVEMVAGGEKKKKRVRERWVDFQRELNTQRGVSC